MKISSSSSAAAVAAAIVLFFITLVFSNPFVSTTSLLVKGQRRAIVPDGKSVDGAVKCQTDRVGHTNWASSRHTRKNYEWLFRNSGEWKAKSGKTGRVRCSRNAAIFIINTTPHDFMVPNADIASIAMEIRQACHVKRGNSMSSKVNGEKMDGRGFVVIVSSAAGCVCLQCEQV